MVLSTLNNKTKINKPYPCQTVLGYGMAVASGAQTHHAVCIVDIGWGVGLHDGGTGCVPHGVSLEVFVVDAEPGSDEGDGEARKQVGANSLLPPSMRCRCLSLRHTCNIVHLGSETTTCRYAL